MRIETKGTFKIEFRALIAGIVSANQTKPIGIIHGSANKLALITQPRSVQVGVPFGVPPFVQIQDAAGNQVETGPESEMVIVAFVATSKPLRGQPPVKTLPLNETRKAAFRGTVKMSSLMVDSEATDIVLRFEAEAQREGAHYSHSQVMGVSSEGFTAANVPARLRIVRNVSSVVGSREPFPVQPVLRLETSNATVYTYSPPGQQIVVIAALDTSDVKLSSQEQAGLPRLAGDLAVPASLGVVTFTNLQVNVMAEGYRLHFTVTSALSAVASVAAVTSSIFEVTVGSPSRLRVLTQPGGASPGLAMSVPPAVSVDDKGGNTVPRPFLVSAELWQYGNVSMQHTVLGGETALAAAGIATFDNLTLSLAGTDFVLRFRVVESDGNRHEDIAALESFPAFRVLPGPAYRLHVDRQPSGAVVWGSMAVTPQVSVRDRGGNKVPQGPHFIYAALVLPAAQAGHETSFNLSLPNPVPRPAAPPSASPAEEAGASSSGSLPSDKMQWSMWLNAASSSVRADSSGTAYFDGLRVFGPNPLRGLAIRFRHCEVGDGSGDLCSPALQVTSQAFDMAGLPQRLELDDLALRRGASTTASTSGVVGNNTLVLTPAQWDEHPLLSPIRVSLLDADGIVVQRLLAEHVSPISTHVGANGQAMPNEEANISISLCFMTDRTEQEFYCRGEPRDPLLFGGGIDSQGVEQPACAMGPDVFLPQLLGRSTSSLQNGRATLRGVSVLSAGVYKFRLRLQAPSLAPIPHVDSATFTVMTGKVAKLVEVREVFGLRPGYAADVQPVVAATDFGGNHVVDACDPHGKDHIRIELLYPEQDTGTGVSQGWEIVPLVPRGVLRYCVAEFSNVQVNRAGQGLRFNYSFDPYIEPVTDEAYTQPSAAELKERARKKSLLAAVSGLYTLSRPITVTTGALHHLSESQMPLGCLAGQACDVQPEIELMDAGGNAVRSFTGSLVAARAVSGAGNAMGVDFQAPVGPDGRAVFTDLLVAAPDRSVQFNYTFHGKTVFRLVGSELDVSSVAAGLVLQVQPGRASPGLAMAQQPELVLVDGNNIRVTSHAAAAVGAVPIAQVDDGPTGNAVAVQAVAYSTRTKSGVSQARQLALKGQQRILMQRGRARFTDLDLSHVGTCLQIKFYAERFPSMDAASASSSSTPLSSDSFARVLQRPFGTESAKIDVVIGAPHHLVPYQQPGNATAGAIFQKQPQVAVHDAGENLVELDSGSAVTALLANGQTRLLQGGAGKIITSKQGLVSYHNLRIDVASTCWVITFKRPGVLPCSSRPLVVRPGKAHRLEILQQPDEASPAQTFVKQPVVRFVDAFDNVLWVHDQQVKAVLTLNGVELPPAEHSSPFPAPYLGSSLGSGLLGDTDVGMDPRELQEARCEAYQSSCEAPAARAIVSFSNLRIDARDNNKGYAIVFKSPEVLPVQSHTFHVLSGAPARLVLLVQPEGFRSGFPLKIQPVVGLHDNGGNIISQNISVIVELQSVVAALGEAPLQLTGQHQARTTSLLSTKFELENMAVGESDAARRAGDGGSGVAEFTDLGLADKIASTASGLVLHFSVACTHTQTCSYASVKSREFTSGGVPTAVALLSSPLSASVAGEVMPIQPRVLIQDDSRVTSEFWDGYGSNYAFASVEMSTILDRNVGLDGRRAELLGNKTTVFRLGVAQWTDLRIEVASQVQQTPFSQTQPAYWLTFRLRGLEWTEGGLVVVHNAPDHYVIWVQPGDGSAGIPASLHGGPVVVVVDRFGNRADGISGGFVNASLVNISAVALSLAPGPFEPVGTLQAPVIRGISNFSLSGGLGAMLAARNLRFNFSGHGVAAQPGVTAGWTFPPLADSSDSLREQRGASPLAMRWIVSEPFVVTNGPVETLVVRQAPQVFVASSLLSPQPIVVLLDRGGNAVKDAFSQAIQISLVRTDGDSTTLGSSVAAEGIAVFSNIGMPSLPAAGARLQYSCSPCHPGDEAIQTFSDHFDVAAFSGSSTVAITQAPSVNIFGGQVFEQQPVVSMHDSGGRLVTADSSTVVRASLVWLRRGETLWELPPASMLTGTSEVTVVRGQALFTDLAITWCNDVASRACSRYAQVHLRFATQQLSPLCAPFIPQYPPVPPPCPRADSEALSVLVGHASQLQVLQQPAGGNAGNASFPSIHSLSRHYAIRMPVSASVSCHSSIHAGAAFISPPIIAVVDAGGNLIDDAPSALQSMRVQVHLQDATSGALIQHSPLSSTEQLFVGSTDVAATVLATAPEAVMLAPLPRFRFTFTDLGVRPASKSFRLFFNTTLPTEPPLGEAQSDSFVLSVGEMAALRIATQPGSGFGGQVLVTQPLVHVVDAGGNLLTETPFWMAVTAHALSGGNERPPDIFAGGEVAVRNGAAASETLAVAQQSACVQLQFKSCLPNNIFDCPYLSPPSDYIMILIGQAARLHVESGPMAEQPAGGILVGQPSVVIQDRGGNKVPNAEETIAVSIECRTTVATSTTTSVISPMCSYLSDHIDGTGSLLPQAPFPPPSTPILPTLAGLTTTVSAQGQIHFTDLQVSRSGGPYRLRFRRMAGFLDEAVTATFRVLTGAPTRLYLKQQPGVSPVPGWILDPQPEVLLVDAGGNLVKDEAHARRIHLLLLQDGYEVFDLNCQPQQQPICRPRAHLQAPALTTRAGVAAFTGLQLHRAGVGYTLLFCDGPCPSRKAMYTNVSGPSAPSVPSVAPRVAWVESWPPLSVTAGPAYKVVLWRELGGCIALLPCTQQPVVLIQDRGGNTLSSLPPTEVAASLVQDDVGAAYSLAGSSAAAAVTTADSDTSTPPPPSSLRDLIVTTQNGRGSFSDIRVNQVTRGSDRLSVAFAASIYNVAVQRGLIVSSTPARLEWERQPPLASLAGRPWQSPQQPVIIIVDQNGVRVDADSQTELRVEVVASDRTLAAGQVEGRGARDADGLLLGERRSKCCRGRCIFTDLAIALAGSDFQLRVSARFAPLHVLQTRVYAAAVTQVEPNTDTYTL